MAPATKRASPGTLLLVQQLRDFPLGDHDDGPDALEMAIRLMFVLWGQRGSGQLSWVPPPFGPPLPFERRWR